MPRVPTPSSSATRIHTIDFNFVDNAGRTILLRGVNLSGSSKAPVDQPSYLLDNFWESAEDGGQSFNGRPLSLEDGSADVHLARLRGWGFNMLRYPVTWEALEHEGPRKYDYEFMDYTVKVLRKCKEYGFRVYMDPHQDTWSRFSGGSGAPFWTLAACGIDPRNMTATQAAILHCEYPLAHEPDPASLPAMIWSTNYGRLLSQTVFTLFFAGRDFAPKCIIDDKNIQDWLQEHYIEAMGKMADRIRDAGGLLDDCVIGWDSLNEPFEGLCGWQDLNATPQAQGSTLKKGTYPTPAQSLRLGMGQAQEIDNWTFGAFGPARHGTVTIDPKGRKIWADPTTETPDGVNPRWGWKRDQSWVLGTCIWSQHGVWDIETGYILRPDYFRYLPNSHPSMVESEEEVAPEVEFVSDYWKPHFVAFAERIRSSHPGAILFVQPPVFAPPPEIEPEVLQGRAAYSAHYYDGLTLVTRHWNWFNADALGLLRGKYSSPLYAVKVGEAAIRKSLQEQLAILKDDTKIVGAYPLILGEIGTPFDMDNKRSYGWTDNGKYAGDYSRQEQALDASLNGADGSNAVNYTIWTYCPDSCHDWGDGWNMEDLSLWSEDDLRVTRKAPPPTSESTLFQGDDNSKALLLRKMTSSAATSALSLATLGISGPVLDQDDEDKVEVTMNQWKENPYDFLTNGARAVRAFSRPWPTKVVGKPIDIKFQISKALFKLVVRVTPEDNPDPHAVNEVDPLATEIYIPLIHFAHPSLLQQPPRGKANHDSHQLRQRRQQNGSPIIPATTSSLPRNTSSSAISTTSAKSAHTSSSSTSSEDGTYLDLLDVEVKVSSGRWKVHGQTLKWWYDVPGPGEPEKEYTIEVKRAGGVVKPQELDEDTGGWCKENGCRIM